MSCLFGFSLGILSKLVNLNKVNQMLLSSVYDLEKSQFFHCFAFFKLQRKGKKKVTPILPCEEEIRKSNY